MGIALGSLLALANRIFGTAFLMVMGIITARALTEEGRGVFVEATVFIGVIGSLVASFSAAAGYFVSNKGMDPGYVAANSLVLSAGAGLVGAGAFFLAAALTDGQTSNIAMLAGLSLFPLIARNSLSGVLLGTGAMMRYGFALYGQAYAAVACLLVWVVMLDHRTAEHAIGAWLVSQYVALAISLALNLSWLKSLAKKPDTALMWHFVTFGTVTGLAGVVSFLNYRVDQLLVNALDGDVGGGIYSTAVVLAESVWLLSTVISIASYSRVGSMAEGDAADLTARAVRHTWIVAVAGMIGLMLLANVLIPILFGARYENAANSLRVLSIGTVLYAPQALISNYFTVTLGRPSVSLALAGFSLVVGTVCCFALIPPFGYIGGAWATTISYAITAIISMGFFLRRSKLPAAALFRIRRSDLEDYVQLAKSLLSVMPSSKLAGARPRP